jgi:hypothetical protein
LTWGSIALIELCVLFVKDEFVILPGQMNSVACELGKMKAVFSSSWYVATQRGIITLFE